ncbi:MAG TPA: HEAT repeat domain-containing protein [Actinoplanes sp.]|nr:HEAT repeat domain-containing protein [Actinoplanes sp.]
MGDRLVHPADSAGCGLMAAATAAGHGERVRQLLEHEGDDSVRADTELMLWAADYGAYELVRGRLEPDTTARMLAIARAWTATDPVAELRRRLGDPAGVVHRHPITLDDGDRTECVRVTAGDGRWTAIQTAHPAIVIHIEEQLGAGVSRDELLARAVADRNPESVNWSEARFTVTGRPDAEATLRWALSVLDDPDPSARRFAADVVHCLSFDQEPSPDLACAALAARLPAEPDADVLISLITAFAEYRTAGFLPEIVAHAGHPDPMVRQRIAGILGLSLPLGADPPGEVMDLLTVFGHDPDPRVRASALQISRDHAFEHPVTAQLIAANSDDPDLLVRVEVLAGLSRGGDVAAYEELRRLGAEAGEHSRTAMIADAARGWLQRARDTR